MGSDYSERLVKPPGMEVVSSGRRFKPASAFKKKYIFITVVTILTIYAMTAVTLFGAAFFVGMIDGMNTWTFFQPMFDFVNFWYWTIAIIILIPWLIVANVYINSIEYSVVGETGKAMPEVYSKRGILDVTERHIPLNAITNVSSRAGPFDRIFGIGSVFIETAGGGRVQLGGVLSVDMKIEGVFFYRELRDYIVEQMRITKGSYRLTTETGFEDEFGTEGVSTGNEMALVLREILRVLRKLDEKLDRLG
ncbi:MAG: PH domain-containing protein [Candidatus Thorarchaeota archaeon]